MHRLPHHVGLKHALPGRILLVDDQAELRRVFRRVLSRCGHQISEASNALQALQLVESGTFELVVSDVQMPDMGGIDLLRAVHERDVDLSVLLISGAPDLGTALKAIEYGAFEYLAKPVDLEKLRVSAQRAIDGCRERREAKDALRQFRSGERARRALPRGGGESWSGALLGGCYRVGALIGQGGMGAVYEAVREDLAHMRVAIKVLQAGFDSEVELLVRFRREAETVAAIDHPNIVRILDFQARDGDVAFLVMERLDGASLGQTIAAEGPFAVNRAAFVASQVLAALAAAHRGNVIHRDLKPDNVFLCSLSGLRDIVKLLDFGIAKSLAASPEQKLTQTGAVMGTLAYMAPEQARGGQVDARSDLYAVGCLLYEMLCGHAPFRAESYNALLFAIQQSSPTPVSELRPDVDVELVAVIEQAMAKDASARFASAEAMADALAPWVSVSPSSAAGSAPPQSSPLAFAPTQLTSSAPPPLSRPACPPSKARPEPR